MIGIIGAMEVEVALLKAKMENPVTERVSGIDFVRGTLMGQDVVLAQCGVGKVFAAVCAQTMIVKFGATIIVNSGVSGTLTKDLHIGDVGLRAARYGYVAPGRSRGDDFRDQPSAAAGGSGAHCGI